MSQLSIAFEGATWILKQDTYDMIAKYAFLLEDVPQLNTYITGFLLTNRINAFHSFFWTFVFFFSFLSMNKAFALIFLAIFLLSIPQLIPRPDNKYKLTKTSPCLRTALIIYFTYHQIELSMNPKKAFILLIIFFCIFMSLPVFIVALIIPLMISSAFINTEQIVDYMHVE